MLFKKFFNDGTKKSVKVLKRLLHNENKKVTQ